MGTDVLGVAAVLEIVDLPLPAPTGMPLPFTSFARRHGVGLLGRVEALHGETSYGLRLASASCPFERWLRNAGRAIAAQIPMIRMTTRRSIR